MQSHFICRKYPKYQGAPSWFSSRPHFLAAPNDPRYIDQVYFSNVQMEAAWDIVKGDTTDIVIAVVDGGVFWRHEDLGLNLWDNAGEIPDNGMDDDGNGYIDDVRGWDFLDDSNDPQGSLDTPINAQHGTQVAGIIAADTDNGVGLAGTTWNAKYMPVNIGCPIQDGALCHQFDGIMYAVINAADIINASFGSLFRSNTGQDFIDFAHDNGSLVIAAAGNLGANNDINPRFPADYNHVLSVGATNIENDQLASFSNFGLEVDLYAPGNGILSTSPFNGYLPNTGTSFGVPLVSGIAALVKAQNPDWGPDQIKEQVRATADDIIGDNPDKEFMIGKGRVNALRALTEATPSVRIVGYDVKDAQGSARIGPSEEAFVTLEISNFLEPVSDLTISLETPTPGIDLSLASTNIAQLNPGDTTTVTFQMQPAPDVERNLNASILTRFSSGDYADIDGFPVLINSTTHNTGNIEVTLTEDGNFGYLDFKGTSPGEGFKYLGFDYLFEGGLIFGNSIITISDNIRGETEEQETDFAQKDGTPFAIVDGRETVEEGGLQLVDTGAAIPLSLHIYQDSFADTSDAYDDFIILKYTIENTGPLDIEDFYAGLFFDWDSISDPTADYVRYEDETKMGYFMNNTPELANRFIATVMLTNNDISFRAINNPLEIYGNSGHFSDTRDGFTAEEKWNYISGGVQVESLDATDVSTLLSGGPFDIPSGESIVVAFAVAAGTSLLDLQTNAGTAQSLWRNKISVLNHNIVSVEEPGTQPAFSFELSDPFPNPSKQDISIDFELAADGNVMLDVYDMLGRKVVNLVQETRGPGAHQVQWDGQGNAGERLASGVYMLRLSQATTAGVKTATKKLVLMR